jgi:hypothetical protein
MSRNCGLESFQSVVPQLALVSIITVPPLRVRQRHRERFVFVGFFSSHFLGLD